MSGNTAGRAHYEELDRADRLAAFREKFDLPEGVIYLDGNSLGPPVKAVQGGLDQAVSGDWAKKLISSWNQAGWFNLPTELGDGIASLIGARPGEIIVGDSTSLNIFKLATALLKPDGNRRKVVVERGNFPTDIYILQGIVRLFEPRFELHLGEHDEIPGLIDEDTALVLLSQVNYRTGRRFDMREVTALAKTAGAPIIWDLCHSAGAFPIDLKGCGVEYAVGCTYKYINGGPGAPAYTYIASESIGAFEPVVTGWHGHARQFAFEVDYDPEVSIKKALVGTPSVLSLIALKEALSVWKDIDLNAIRAKSLALTDAFIALVEDRCAGHGLTLLTPREHDLRGSQVTWSVKNGYEIMQALIERGVIGDYRAPDAIRFGFTPLYTRFTDVYDAVTHLKDVLDTQEWRNPEFAVRRTVT
jgi:kynureninase